MSNFERMIALLTASKLTNCVLAKRKPKNPIKFNISLNEEQKHAKSVILHNTITVLTGLAGGPALFETAELLGKAETIERMTAALSKLA